MAKNNKKNNSANTNGTNTVLTFASGMILGVLVAPYAKELFNKLGPMVNDGLDQFSTKASDLTEKGADIIAQAKEKLQQTQVN